MSDSNEETNCMNSPPTSPCQELSSLSNEDSSPKQNSSPPYEQAASPILSHDESAGSDTSGITAEPNTSPVKGSSPPSSPVRYGRKRPAYSTYQFNPSEPIPRQTVYRWKKQARLQSESSDENDNGGNSECDEAGAPVRDDDRSETCVEDMYEGPHLAVPADPDLEVSLQDCASDVSTHGESRCSSSAQNPSDDEMVSDIDSERALSDCGESSCSSRPSAQNPSDDEMVSDIDSEHALSDCGDYNNPFGDETLLYPDCEKLTDEAVLELLDVHIRNNLTKTTLGEFLKIYVSSLPANHNMPPTLHYLFKYVEQMSIPVKEVKHYYCRPGLHEVDSKNESCNICQSNDIGVFYELPIEAQIKYLFEQCGLANLLDNYWEQKTQRRGFICDLSDSSEYARVWQGVVDKYKVTLVLNTDGVQPHTTSSAKLWPIMYNIVEVSPNLRSSLTIVWGIWFDKKYKPNMNMNWKPFVSSLVEIDRAGGISWLHPETNVRYVSPVRAPLIVADAPARAGVVNMQEHQARYACNTCEQKTNKLPAPPLVMGEKKKNRKRRFLFQEEPARIRTHQRMVAMAKYASKEGIEHKRGMKGPATIQALPAIDLSTCVNPEYLHSVLKGVVLQLCSLWFFVKGEWFIGNHLNEINHFLCNEIHPPDFVTRLPRSLDYFSYFRANELRSILLYYSLIFVAPYMKEKYIQHWMLFVEAIFLLLQECISEADLDSAESLLRMFVRDIGNLYGDDQYTYNIHQMTHLVLHVRRWGGLWANSAFSFESFNGTISRMIHGSKNEGKELMNELFLAQGLQLLKNRVNQQRRTGNISHGVKVLGKPLPRILTAHEKNCLNLNFTGEVKLYGRIAIGRELYSSLEYDKDFKRRNSYVEFIDANGKKKIGQIIVFCSLQNSVKCFISVFRVVHSKFFHHQASRVRIRHIVPVQDSEEIIMCDVNNLEKKLIQVGSYLCFPPNSFERNL